MLEENKNLKINVDMDGDQYLKVLQYKQSLKKKLTVKDKQNITLIGVVALMTIMVLIVMAYSQPTPEPSQINLTWHSVAMFVSLCGGLGWVFHGTGFLLIRR